MGFNTSLCLVSLRNSTVVENAWDFKNISNGKLSLTIWRRCRAFRTLIQKIALEHHHAMRNQNKIFTLKLHDRESGKGWKLIHDIFIWIEFIITLLIAFITYKTLWLQGRRYLSCARGQKPNWRIKIKIELGSLLGCPFVFYILPVKWQNVSN